MHEGIEPPLLLQHVGGGGAGGFGFERQVHALMAAVLFGVARRDALEPNAEPQPPDREFAQSVQRVR